MGRRAISNETSKDKQEAARRTEIGIGEHDDLVANRF
jgi:hypothetical protein